MSNNCLLNVLEDVSLDRSTAPNNMDMSPFTTPPQAPFLQDDCDIFQCGKCKLVLSTITDFMIHKRQHTNTLENVQKAEVVLEENVDLVTFGEPQIWLWPNFGENFLTNTSEAEISLLDNTELTTSNDDQQVQQNQELMQEQQHQHIEKHMDQQDLEHQLQQHEIEQKQEVLVQQNQEAPPTENLHSESNTKVPKLKCGICSKHFSKQFDLRQHYRSHSGERPYQCAICGRAFAQKSNVNKHMSTHKIWPDDLSKTLPENGDTNFVCTYCKQSYDTYMSLKAHLKVHKDKQLFKCIQLQCNGMFQDAMSLLYHVNESHPNPIYRCYLCNFQINSLDEMAAHQQTHPDVTEKRAKRYQCILCKSFFSSPESLSKHTATAVHVHECSICKKTYTAERYLRRHLNVHNTTVEYICNICGKTFRTEQYLNSHKLLHNSFKQYSCSQCPARFNRKDKLLRHANIHLPNKKFKCPFSKCLGCTKEFHRSDKLKLHLDTHINPKKRKKKPKPNKIIKSSQNGKMENVDMINTTDTMELIVVKLKDTDDIQCNDEIKVTCVLPVE